MNVREFFSSRKLKYGAVSGAVTIVVLVVLILINVITTVLDQKYSLSLDLTPGSAFKISQPSAEYINDLKAPVSISVLVNEKQLESTGDIYFTQAKSIIDQYSQLSGNITVKYVDIISDPTFVAKYEDMGLNYGDILVESSERSRKVNINEMFNVSYNQYTGQSYIASSKAEQMLTSAIMGVTSGEIIKVGLLTGHAEMEMPALSELLEQNNFEVTEQNLTTGELDPQVDVLFMIAPTRDPDPQMLDKLDSFLSNGGSYGKTLVYAANIEQPPLPNLEAFLADWGIAVPQGAVLETDQNKIFNYNQFFCTTEYADSAEYMQNVPNGIKTSMPFGRPLSMLFDSQSGYTVTTLLNYSETAAVMPLDATDDWAPTELSAVPAALRSTYTHYEGGTPMNSNLFAFSSASAFEGALLNSSSVANAEFIVSIMNSITAREDVITLAPKSLGGTELGITQFQSSLISMLLIYLLPGAVVIFGIVVWLRRRRR